MKICIGLLLSVIITNFANAVPNNANSDFQKNLEYLKYLVSESNAKTIEDFLKVLPLEIKSNYVLIYDSKGLNGYRVDHKNPRVIMFSPQGKHVIAFTKPLTADETGKELDSVEVINFKNGEFRLSEIIFDGKNHPVFSKQRESTCLRCHGGDSAKPLFDPYPIWRGSYGSLRKSGFEFINKNSLEYQHYTEWLDNKKTNVIYNLVPEPIGPAVYPSVYVCCFFSSETFFTDLV